MSILDVVGVGLRKIFGSRNERLLRRYQRQVDLASTLEEEIRGDYDRRFDAELAQLSKPGQGGALSTPTNPESSGSSPWTPAPTEEAADPALAEQQYAEAVQHLRVQLSQDLRDRAATLRQRLADDESVALVLSEAFALLREASRRARNHRHFDCQLVGGQVLFEGRIAEMKTGEGKTIVCHLAAFLKNLQGHKVHIVTVNDYLVQRDAEFARPIFELLGLTVGYIQSQVDPGGYEGVRAKAYACDITYGTNNEFGFDYLRDNMKTSLEAQVQGRLDFTIVDEVDSILIDEARTPLIISGPAEDNIDRYRTADQVSRVLLSRQSSANNETAGRVRAWGDHPPENLASQPKFADALRKFKSDPNWINEDEAEALGHRQFYVVSRERKQVTLTHQGIGVAQDQLGVGSLYVGQNMEWPHVIENSLRAHIVYEKDVDYAVMNGEIIIVDPFTGRLMHGRQWSDGLHQSVEAKEGVRIKEETQTLATITLQNFFKLYKSLSGMTGTAMTEADEFVKIYNLDVVSVPTNRPVNRLDYHDRIYKSVDDKYNAIVEEIHDVHTKGRPNDPYVLEPVLRALRTVMEGIGRPTQKIDEALKVFESGKGDSVVMAEAYDEAMGDLARGRPILVGTISIENSEKLSNMLTRKYGIQHEVLNAKQHAREAEIVKKAGETHQTTRKHTVGNVTIATNMAGRGTDIKLQKGVVFEKCIGDLGAPENGHGRAWGWRERGVVGTKCCINCPDYDARTNCAHCWKPKADARFPTIGRKVCPLNVPCGLHIVGTERHESRRIDNQLRGRSGRQGDPGSSRFFLSLGDDLLKMFMGEWTLRMLERMGFEDGMAIEARSINKGIERAQKKVEERNFGIRKHLLEYDEVMDHQRKAFYAQRQSILEAARPGNSGHLVELIWQMINDTIGTASTKFLAGDYGQQCVVEWVRAKLECDLSAKQVEIRDVVATEVRIREEARTEAFRQIETTVGEYLDADTDQAQWDIRGLARWAETRFGCNISQNQLRNMEVDEVRQELMAAAEKKIAEFDLSPIEQFMDEDYGKRTMVVWARQKFGIELEVEEYAALPNEEISGRLRDGIRSAYRDREIRYPVEWILERTVLQQGGTNAYAADDLARWANMKFALGWTVDNITNRTVKDVADQLVELNREYTTGGKLQSEVDQAIAGSGLRLEDWSSFHTREGRKRLAAETHDPQSAISRMVAWGRQRFGPAFDESVFLKAEDPRAMLLAFGEDLLRRELTALERYVLLQIYDQAWKEHMRAIESLKEAIGLRSFAEQDPRIAYKREGFQMFQEMMDLIKDKVTGIIFRARLSGELEAQTRYRISAAQHSDATNQGFTAGVDRDRAAAMQAQGEQKIQTIRREKPKVGRNEACPCGSGKKFKQCCGRGK